MSQTETQTQEIQLSPVQKLQAEFAKKNKLIIMPDEDGTLFAEMLELTEGEGEAAKPVIAYVDWTLKTKDNAAFSGGALVREKEGGQVRLITFANKETALNDAVVQDWAYNRYVNAVVKAAMRADAFEDQFTVPAGPLSMALDTEHFDERVEVWIGVIAKRFSVKLKKRAFAYCLEDAAFAQSQYPGIKGWDKLIGAMAKDAEDHGMSAAYYAHCLATRSIAKHETKKIDFGTENLDELLAAVDAAGKKAEAEASVATA